MDKIDELNAKIDGLKETYTILETKTEKQLWNEDLESIDIEALTQVKKFIFKKKGSK